MAAQAQEGTLSRRHPVLHASRVVAWAETRAGWMRKLHLMCGFYGALEAFTPEQLRSLVGVVASSLTELRIACGSYERHTKRFWDALLQEPVVAAGRLRSFVVEGNIGNVDESDVKPPGAASRGQPRGAGAQHRRRRHPTMPIITGCFP